MRGREFGMAFDLEGPLVNLEEGHHAAYLRIAESIGCKLTLDEALRVIPHFIGGPEEEINRELFGLSDQTLVVEEIGRRKNELYQAWLSSLQVVPTRKGVFEFLNRVRTRGIRNVIGTATSKDLVDFYVSRSGLDVYFPPERIITANDVTKPKPDPETYFKTAEIMGIHPKDQIVFEDSPRGVKAGVAAGSIVIGLPVYFTDRVIRSLKDAGATVIYREWDEVELEALNLLKL